ncbi:primosomal protein N', partial [Candidatus Saccharibacteria bacterium]|nr:primosomal protein N' [Candidatus Saccharibacteria bacterium]
CPGIVLKRVKRPDFPCRPIEKLLYPSPLTAHLLKSLLWLSSYYLSDLPSCASLLLPAGVEKHRKRKSPSAKLNCCSFATKEKSQAKNSNQPYRIELNSAQLAALSKLKSLTTPTRLLFGITGSGKTNIYLKLTEETLNSGKSAILLVPEIALTSQLVEIFESAFPGQLVLLHSRQTEAERHLAWESILTASSPLVVLGPRSALFAPLSNLGLIILDEAHESSYFQDNSPHYSALRLASFIAKTLNIPCILGSATPLVSDYFLAKSKNSLISLTKKAKATSITPDIKVVDMTSRDSFPTSRYFSAPLLKTLEDNLKNHYQTLIYHNRRGSAPLTLCESCGWQALCPNCFLPLILHSDSFSLLCHTCGFSEKIPASCPNCHSPSILHKGFGTKLLETELNKLFTQARIIRFDADNKKGETLDSRFDEVKRGDFDIIIGTQTVSRGLDLPLLASIGVVQADAGLSLPDFSAEERTFELLTQVIGRVGRGHLPSASVIIQTYQPASPVINFAISADYPGFYDYMIKKRHHSFLPPFAYLAKLSATFKTEATALKKIRSASRALNKFIIQNSLETSLKLSPPTPCFHERISSGFSWQLILKSSSRSALLRAISSLDPALSIRIVLDPPSLL